MGCGPQNELKSVSRVLNKPLVKQGENFQKRKVELQAEYKRRKADVRSGCPVGCYFPTHLSL
jgi:hypothetical protein